VGKTRWGQEWGSGGQGSPAAGQHTRGEEGEKGAGVGGTAAADTRASTRH